MSDKEKIKNVMSILRKMGYTARMSLNTSTTDSFVSAIQKTHKGAFIIGHDMDDTYDKEDNLTRRVYLAWIGNEPEEILGVCFNQGLNVYWRGQPGWAIEICPSDKEVPEMYF